jgi:glutamate formiminotransferase
VIEAVVNVSEGRDDALIRAIGEAAGGTLLDVHSDPHHHRSVFTLAGTAPLVERGALELARRAVELLDISEHDGVHPRLGVVDVVPFVPYDEPFEAAVEARDRFAVAFGEDGVPCFSYGPERSLPVIRRDAFIVLSPDTGPPEPHPTAGATCVGARPVLIAYNLVVHASLEQAREIARTLRRPQQVRSLAFPLGNDVQLSFNLIDPYTIGPEQVYDLVSRLVRIERAELVGLVPERVLADIPARRLAELGLSPEATVETRLAASRGRARDRS